MNLKPDNNSIEEKKGSSDPSELSNPSAQNQMARIIDLRFRLKGMEESNIKLEKHSTEQSVKLAEVIETNAKFLSILAHDLRSPFITIIGALALLRDSYNDHDIALAEKYIRMATNSANGTLNLLDNLLMWTAEQNKATYFNPEQLNFNKMVDEEIDNNRVSASHKQITLNQSIPYNLNIVADVQMVKTILRNLINNAIKYSFIGGRITISASEESQFIVIVVEDNGIGITHKAHKELFTEKKIHSTRGTNNEKGTGLGLALCKEFVEKHGGTIRVESEPEKGSKFIFTLPRFIPDN
ncbi:MAG: HAMP domain-containing histidine kinase [Lentimicrobium sp.]|nr:HAMP domain-containing histidine kinase [Lentimicrobium sp.]